MWTDISVLRTSNERPRKIEAAPLTVTPLPPTRGYCFCNSSFALFHGRRKKRYVGNARNYVWVSSDANMEEGRTRSFGVKDSGDAYGQQ